MRLKDAQALRKAAARKSLQRIRNDQVGAPPNVSRALSMLAARLFEPGLTAKRLRRDCQIRDSSFSFCFRRQCQLSPAAYLTDLRLETANVLLTSSQLAVHQIAELIGYSSSKVFSNAFARWAGARPSAYREHAQRLPPAVREELLDMQNLRLASTGELDADVAHRLIEHLKNTYGLEE